MAVVIRLQRTGKPKQPYFRVVAIDKTRGQTGKPIEVLGSYNPRLEHPGKKVQINKDRFDHWIKCGALPSQTVASLVKEAVRGEAK